MRQDVALLCDPGYLRHLAKMFEKRGHKADAARLTDIAFKLEQLQECQLKGLMAYIRELKEK